MSITGNWDRRRISRRRFLTTSGMGAAGLALGTHGLWLPRRGLAQTNSTDPSYPFKLGVASGDPWPDSVVLWTRLTPGNPLTGGGTVTNTTVSWEVAEAEDPDFTNPVKSGTVTTDPKLAHSVHVEVTGLDPATTYYYRFTNGIYSSDSPPGRTEKTPGRTKTAPASGASVPSMRLAFASCQHWESGLYHAYRDIAQRNGSDPNKPDLDLVIHLGDYIYEGAPSNGKNLLRRHSDVEDANFGCNTLADYRNRHAQYKTDPDLQAAHRMHPWVVTWDDHEVENDYAGLDSWYPQKTSFSDKRAAAYQAYYEHMPLRRVKREEKILDPLTQNASGQVTNINLYRQISYGDLAQFLVLDLRQFRTLQPCGDQGSLIEDNCKDRLQDPILRNRRPYRRHTILGTIGDKNSTPGGTDDEQETWLKRTLTSSGTPTWNVIAQQVIMFQYDHESWYGEWYSEGWDSYVATRNRILKHIMDNRVPNPVVLTGDMHSAWAANLESNFNDRKNTDIIGTEFAGTSISSILGTGPGSWDEIYREAMPHNKHVKHYDGRNGGYVLCQVTPEYWQADYYLASSLSRADASVGKVASWYAQAGSKDGVTEGTPLG